MNTDNITLNKLATERLITGITKACAAIEGALGAAGSNVIVESDLYPFHILTNDGKEIVSGIKLQDPVENIGANIIKEVGDKAEKDSGDGRKTTMILTKSILQEAMKLKSSPMEIKRSLDACLPIILKSIDDQKKEITVNDVAPIASIAGENVQIGEMLQEIYQEIGKDGVIEMDVSSLPETFYEVTDGVRLRNAGFLWPYMANDAKGQVATYTNPKILITKQKMATNQDLDRLFKTLSEKGVNELVIFADEVDLTVSQALAMVHTKGIFKTLVIKAPTLWKDWLYEDFAKITGATIVNPAEGISFKNLKLEHLGTCEKIITTKDQTTVIGIKDISQHIENLKAEGTNDTKLRLAWLQTKAAILKVGASSETELKYNSLKARDARNAAFLALQDGVVAGGGLALFNASKELPDGTGGDILRVALSAPLEQIIINAGADKRLDKLGRNFGFNAKNAMIADMWKEQILDPVSVVKNAITNAISVAGTILTAKVVVTIPDGVRGLYKGQ